MSPWSGAAGGRAGGGEMDGMRVWEGAQRDGEREGRDGERQANKTAAATAVKLNSNVRARTACA